jgi:hypothetical protein
MRLILILAAVIALLAIAGWITFHNEPGRASINLETDEIREDTGHMMQEGAELLREARDEVKPESPEQNKNAADQGP